MKRVILTTGGTGGHIFPALAVAEALRAENPGVELLFVGGTYGPEAELASKAGLEFHGLPVRGMLGRGVRGVVAAGRMGVNVLRAVALLRRWKPAVVAGFGGYASFPCLAAAGMLGVPALLQEQNSIPGAANRLAARFVRRVCLSFEDAEKYFPDGKSVFTGNPVREAIRDAALAARGDDSRRLLVLGGSLGAKSVNEAVVQTLPMLRDAGVEIFHQTGRTDYERTCEAYRAAGADPSGGETCVRPFIEDMAGAYGWADLVVCRAGATTVAELCVAGRPSILVPFPHATHNHQVMNGRSLEKAGAGIVVEEKNLSAIDLAGRITGLLADRDALRTMGTAAEGLGRPDAANRVAHEVARLAGDRR